MKKLPKTTWLRVRIDENVSTFIKNSAEVYAEGNISEWVRYCCMNYQPKYLKKKRPEKSGPSQEEYQGEN